MSDNLQKNFSENQYIIGENILKNFTTRQAESFLGVSSKIDAFIAQRRLKNWFKLKDFLKNHYIHYQWEILVTKCLTDKDEKRIIAILERLQQIEREWSNNSNYICCLEFCLRCNDVQFLQDVSKVFGDRDMQKNVAIHLVAIRDTRKGRRDGAVER